MRTHRTLRLRREVVAELADGDLASVVAADGSVTGITTFFPTMCFTCLTCMGTDMTCSVLCR